MFQFAMIEIQCEFKADRMGDSALLHLSITKLHYATYEIEIAFKNLYMVLCSYENLFIEIKPNK